MKMKWFAGPDVVWMVLFTVAPMFLIVWYAVADPSGTGVTVQHLLRFGDWVYIKVLLRSIGMAALCTAICLLVGYPVAWILSRRKKSGILARSSYCPLVNFLCGPTPGCLCWRIPASSTAAATHRTGAGSAALQCRRRAAGHGRIIFCPS
jgi:hypothetical protein